MIVALMLGGLFLGIVMGMWFPWAIPISYAPFPSVAIMACLDSVFGGLRSYMEGKYDHTIFFSGFFANALVAMLFVFIGSRLGIDIYCVALLSFGLRIFDNAAAIRRIWLNERKTGVR